MRTKLEGSAHDASDDGGKHQEQSPMHAPSLHTDLSSSLSSSGHSSVQTQHSSPLIPSATVERTAHKSPKIGRHSKDLRALQVCPAGSLTTSKAPSEDAVERPTCEFCPSGRYQHQTAAMDCRSCPPGFVNNLNGSEFLADCCIQQYEVGLYNDGVATSYSLFGYANGTLSSVDFQCPNGRYYPSQSCTRILKNISTMPSTNESNIGTASQGACSDVYFTIQPMLGSSPVASLLALDFNCPDCVFEVGKDDNVTISIYRVSDHTIMPRELRSTPLRPPSSDFRDYQHSEAPLDHARDVSRAIFQFDHSTFNSNPNISRHEIPSELSFISPQAPVNRTLSNWNDVFDRKQSQYMCSYEDPGGSFDRSLATPPRSSLSLPLDALT